MPDEFQLRPHSTDDACSNRYRRKLAMMNDEYEQGARALAAAIIEKHFARIQAYMSAGIYDKAELLEACINDIHRLVPPKEKA